MIGGAGAWLLDQRNAATGKRSHEKLAALCSAYRRLTRRLTPMAEPFYEGNCPSNRTVGRMVLDVNRAFLCGRADGKLADRPIRRILTIVDAICSGEGDGPLAPVPKRLGLLIGGWNPYAVDLVCAGLMGYEPAHIPIFREASRDSFHRVFLPAPDQVAVRTSGAPEWTFDEAIAAYGQRFHVPPGWEQCLRN